jgi:hypothetical protein
MPKTFLLRSEASRGTLAVTKAIERRSFSTIFNAQLQNLQIFLTESADAVV